MSTMEERIKAVIDREVDCIVVVRSEHHPDCPGGGPDCGHAEEVAREPH